METQVALERIIQNLAFEVEAVPKNDAELNQDSQNIPMNVKIRVRKKPFNTKNVKSAAFTKHSGTDKPTQLVHLSSSNQTVLSFDLSMSNISESASTRHHFLNFWRNGTGRKVDGLKYPQVPSSSYYNAKLTSRIRNGQNGQLKQKFTLTKTSRDRLITKRTPTTFFGKCKPGGCLDPSANEDNYSYQPSNISIETKKTSNIYNKIQVPPVSRKDLSDNISITSAQSNSNRDQNFLTRILKDGISPKKSAPLNLDYNNLNRADNTEDKIFDGSSRIRHPILDNNNFKKKINSSDTSSSSSRSSDINLSGCHSQIMKKSSIIVTYPTHVTPNSTTRTDDEKIITKASETKSIQPHNEFPRTHYIHPKNIDGTQNNIVCDRLNTVLLAKKRSEILSTAEKKASNSGNETIDKNDRKTSTNYDINKSDNVNNEIKVKNSLIRPLLINSKLSAGQVNGKDNYIAKRKNEPRKDFNILEPTSAEVSMTPFAPTVPGPLKHRVSIKSDVEKINYKIKPDIKTRPKRHSTGGDTTAISDNTRKSSYFFSRRTSSQVLKSEVNDNLIAEPKYYDNSKINKTRTYLSSIDYTSSKTKIPEEIKTSFEKGYELPFSFPDKKSITSANTQPRSYDSPTKEKDQLSLARQKIDGNVSITLLNPTKRLESSAIDGGNKTKIPSQIDTTPSDINKSIPHPFTEKKAYEDGIDNITSENIQSAIFPTSSSTKPYTDKSQISIKNLKDKDNNLQRLGGSKLDLKSSPSRSKQDDKEQYDQDLNTKYSESMTPESTHPPRQNQNTKDKSGNDLGQESAHIFRSQETKPYANTTNDTNITNKQQDLQTNLKDKQSKDLTFYSRQDYNKSVLSIKPQSVTSSNTLVLRGSNKKDMLPVPVSSQTKKSVYSNTNYVVSSKPDNVNTKRPGKANEVKMGLKNQVMANSNGYQILSIASDAKVKILTEYDTSKINKNTYETGSEITSEVSKITKFDGELEQMAEPSNTLSPQNGLPDSSSILKKCSNELLLPPESFNDTSRKSMEYNNITKCNGQFDDVNERPSKLEATVYKEISTPNTFHNEDMLGTKDIISSKGSPRIHEEFKNPVNASIKTPSFNNVHKHLARGTTSIKSPKSENRINSETISIKFVDDTQPLAIKTSLKEKYFPNKDDKFSEFSIDAPLNKSRHKNKSDSIYTNKNLNSEDIIKSHKGNFQKPKDKPVMPSKNKVKILETNQTMKGQHTTEIPDYIKQTEKTGTPLETIYSPVRIKHAPSDAADEIETFKKEPTDSDKNNRIQTKPYENEPLTYESAKTYHVQPFVTKTDLSPTLSKTHKSLKTDLKLNLNETRFSRTVKRMPKQDIVTANLAFQSHVNKDNLRVIKTLDPETDTKPTDDSITIIKLQQFKFNNNEVKIPIDPEHSMTIFIKQHTENQDIIETHSETAIFLGKHLPISDQEGGVDDSPGYPHKRSLEYLYEKELIPLHYIIKDLKKEIDALATQQMAFKEKIYAKKGDESLKACRCNKFNGR